MRTARSSAVATLVVAALLPGGALATPDCVPQPHLAETVALVEPQGTAIADARGLWIEFSVVPFDEDIRQLFVISATATPLDAAAASRPETLTADVPIRLSGESTGGRVGPIPALWLVRLSLPSSAARVSIDYSISLWQTPSGTHCEGRATTRHIGDVRWIPTNGRGPFGAHPPGQR